MESREQWAVKQNSHDIATRLFNMGLSAEQIADTTGITNVEIESIRLAV